MLINMMGVEDDDVVEIRTRLSRPSTPRQERETMTSLLAALLASYATGGPTEAPAPRGPGRPAAAAPTAIERPTEETAPHRHAA